MNGIQKLYPDIFQYPQQPGRSYFSYPCVLVITFHNNREVIKAEMQKWFHVQIAAEVARGQQTLRQTSFWVCQITMCYFYAILTLWIWK